MMRARGSLVVIVLLFPVTAARAGDISLDNGGTLHIEQARYNRALPQSFYDQARASLPRLYPDHELLAGRRSGRIGNVVYSLICYRESPGSNTVSIQAVAVQDQQAWNLYAVAEPSSYAGYLVRTLEQISRLPAAAGDR